MFKIIQFFKRELFLFILILMSIGIKIFSLFPHAVEKYYSNGLYHYSSMLQRWIFGWIPFSIGDWVYIFIILYLLVKLYQFIRYFKLSYLYTIFKSVLMIYVVFNLLWGLNYNRENIYERYDLEQISLDSVNINLFAQTMVNRLIQLGDQSKQLHSNTHNNLDMAANAMKLNHPFYFASIKPSLFGKLGNYLGYSGYYNPLTGEAQVNTKIPRMTIPYTATHEIGHQLGAAKESEANFVGFLAAIKSGDAALQYSAYFDGYLYAEAFIKRISPSQLELYRAQLPDWVKNDIQEMKDFWVKYRNPIDRFITMLYGQYLKANDQPEGMLSYSGLVTWLIAYAEKHGWEKL